MNTSYSLRGLFTYTLLSSFTLVAAVVFFLSQLAMPQYSVAWLYLTSIPSYYYLIVLLATVLFIPLYFIPYVRYIALLPKILFDIFLIGDISVFNLYRFHVDSVFIQMVLFDFKGMGFSNYILGLTAVGIVAIAALNVWLFRACQRWQQSIAVVRLHLVVFALFFCGQFMHIWGYQYNQSFIIRYTPALPLYFPTTSHKTMVKLEENYSSWLPKPLEKPSSKHEILADQQASGLFKYPNQPVMCQKPQAQKHNVLFFVLESWQQRMLSAQVTPNMWAFSRDKWRFANHFSGGSVTVTGLFSLLYGLQPNYLPLAQAAPYQYQTMLTKTLAAQGYQIDAYTQSNLNRFNMKQMFFGDIADKHYFSPTGEIDRADQQVVDQLSADIRNADGAPWFKFAFLTSSHHNYFYPPSDQVFEPVAQNSEAYLFDKHMDAEPFLNDYKNSLYFIDRLFAQVIRALRESGQVGNTIVVITGDHGEEFNENKRGFWGHGSNFTKYQAAVPLVLSVPGTPGSVISQRSGHVDIVPTVLQQAAGCWTAPQDYSSGYNLLDLPSQRGLEIRSYNNKAYLIGDRIYTTALGLQSYNVNDINEKYTDIEYEKINQLRKELQRFSQ